MAATEPILLLMSLFIALIYGLLVRPPSTFIRLIADPSLRSMPSSSVSPLFLEKTTAIAMESLASCSVPF